MQSEQARKGEGSSSTVEQTCAEGREGRSGTDEDDDDLAELSGEGLGGDVGEGGFFHGKRRRTSYTGTGAGGKVPAKRTKSTQ